MTEKQQKELERIAKELARAGREGYQKYFKQMWKDLYLQRKC